MEALEDANVRFDNYYAYNSNTNNKSTTMSGFTTEPTEYNKKANMIHGKQVHNTLTGIEFIVDDLDDELQVSRTPIFFLRILFILFFHFWSSFRTLKSLQ